MRTHDTVSSARLTVQILSHVLIVWILTLLVCLALDAGVILLPLRWRLFSSLSFFVSYFQVIQILVAMGFVQLSTVFLRRRLNRLSVVTRHGSTWRLAADCPVDRQLNLRLLFALFATTLAWVLLMRFVSAHGPDLAASRGFLLAAGLTFLTVLGGALWKVALRASTPLRLEWVS